MFYFLWLISRLAFEHTQGGPLHSIQDMLGYHPSTCERKFGDVHQNTFTRVCHILVYSEIDIICILYDVTQRDNAPHS
jgi:hypothetical protein